ncbi:MAG: tripartite tricarboxylate transporter substrate binding protein BugD [Hyphomicrobiales bacterium]|nr:tripartite tricarboxylate transporter substrate binding protein BugD [Hyphomicrobiales bacterium]
MILARTLVAAGIAAASVSLSAAQDRYPTRPITLVVPFAAGGASDVLTRIVAESLGQRLGQSIIIQNVAGAGGTVGSGRVVKSAPDGYTLLSHHIGLSTAPTLYKDLPFSPLTDLAYIGLVAEAPMAIVARKDFPPTNLKELISYLQKQQDKITYANAGVGGASYLCGMLLGETIGVKFTNVPYTGAGPALVGMLSGQTDIICDLTTGTTGYIQSGQLNGYALTARQRLKTLPELPTTAEAGLPGFEITVWYGLYAPAKTPAPIVERLSTALQEVMQDPAVAERLAAIETTLVSPQQATPRALQQRMEEQHDLWRSVIMKAGQGK